MPEGARTGGRNRLARTPTRRIVRAALVLTAVVFVFLTYLLYVREPAAATPGWAAALPHANAGLNAATTLAVVAGVLAIRSGRRRLHAGLLIAAATLGSLFLASYVTYHHYHGDTPFPGVGLIRPTYFAVLITHVLASAGALPLVITTLALAAAGRFGEHRRWARATVPVWLYAAVSGLAVYAMLYL